MATIYSIPVGNFTNPPPPHRQLASAGSNRYFFTDKIKPNREVRKVDKYWL
jgi:hypothetical protein